MSHTNRLSRETSPYLLQHAHNPVDWYAWGEEALERARSENKLLLISIGYSACHWCHVMERESFENEETAELMNRHFVCIKVDREERPDIDQVYMNAVQLITGQGGWPLNCFALPDGRPVYGGTYFRPDQWRGVLRNLADLYVQDPGKVTKYADELTRGVRHSERMDAPKTAQAVTLSEIEEVYSRWQQHFDAEEGGMDRAPKFPLPNNWQFLLRYGHATSNEAALQQVRLTLDKMAQGGIYDQLGGGFARYSTDGMWKAPHFEKMLYDNAQLMELYAEAYRATSDPLYARVVRETAEFVARELTAPDGAFYSALDADSEGEEGKFYVWTKEELEAELGLDFPVFQEAYSVNSAGYWEDGNYILLRRKSDEDLIRESGLTEQEWNESLVRSRARLMAARDCRVRPGLDDKTLVSWNALMCKGYLAGYLALGDESFLRAAERNLSLLLGAGRRPDGGLYRAYKAEASEKGAAQGQAHVRQGQADGLQTDAAHGQADVGQGRFTINAFLDDYAFMIEALVAIYQATFEETWLNTAKELADYAIAHFRDPVSGLFFFTSDLDPPLVARKMEVIDNVTPASNSSLAKSLFLLGALFGDTAYTEMSEHMVAQVRESMPGYGSGYSNWCMLALQMALPFHEVAILGPEAKDRGRELAKHYAPNIVMAGGDRPSTLSLLEGRFQDGRTLFYVCRNRTCGLPTESLDDVLAQLGRQ